jgi:hypothetical protein
MTVVCDSEYSLQQYIGNEKEICKEETVYRPMISCENIERLKAIQELIYLEEGQALTTDEVINRVLQFFQKYVPY